MKQLRKPIFYLQWLLISFSIIGFSLASIEGFKQSFFFSSIGFQNYLKLFIPYSILFAATFVVITANLAIERLGLMNDANQTSFKANTRVQWIQIVKEFLIEIKQSDPFMGKEMSKQLIALHDYLFDKEYKFNAQPETQEFFTRFFANRITFFEEMNTKYMNLACYHDKTQSYSWDAFRYIDVQLFFCKIIKPRLTV